jgi:hypothetical protein
MCFCLSVDELDSDPDAIRCLAHTSFHDVVDAELTRNLLRLYCLSFVNENSVAGDYKHFVETRQFGDDVLG